MSRVLLILVFVLWLTAAQGGRQGGLVIARGGEDLVFSVGAFLGFYVLLVGGLGAWGRLITRRFGDEHLRRRLRRFNKWIAWARTIIPVWFGLAVFVFGWTEIVARIIGPRLMSTTELPGLLVGTAPALLAWAGLWWAQFPADRAMRHESALLQLEADLPVHAPPDFWSYFVANLRLQLLFTIVPVILIVLIDDVASIGYRTVRHKPMPDTAKVMVQLAAAVFVFLIAPEVLRRVLHTQRLPDSSLRRKLEAMCKSTGLGYRDILLWRTQNNMGNAAVMGLIPRVRYILLSDLLLETMTDEQIEAVFAHEAGHVVHHHMAWYGVFIAIFILTTILASDLFDAQLQQWARSFPDLDKAIAIGGFGVFWLAFGFLSRSFERQADVFAARTMQQTSGVPEAASPKPETHVGPIGARIFASALYRVAVVNNIPVAARNWTHGSIATRMKYLEDISEDPRRTFDFDRRMTGVYMALVAALVGCGVGLTMILMR